MSEQQHPKEEAISNLPLSILKEYWGYDKFRPLQEDIIRSVLEGKDTLALLPTGGGKSICYQVPALCKEGLCLVISPLIALMKDQVEQLRRRNITAFAIFSGMSRKDVVHILSTAASSNCKFLYVSPERLETQLFLDYLPNLNISLVAVDEAHCISQWGYDFRPPYLRIAQLREYLDEVPVLALTASATPKVQEDIMQQLAFEKPVVFRQSFERPNLSYSVFDTDTPINRIIDILQKVPGCSLVYCRSRRRCKEISGLLQMQGIEADYYHAGLSAEERSAKQEAWIRNKIRTMVCTNAFGMGIDKPDVRIVIHADVPECLENFYQEAGRAGRDGNKAYAVLLYTQKALQELQELPTIRFPEIEALRSTYQSIMNYLQLPAYSGAGEYFAFDLSDFTRKFKVPMPLLLATLKTLEQEALLSFNEQVFLPSRVQFISNKDVLYEFEKLHASLEPLIKTLLRTYEGVYDHAVSIFESQLGYILKVDKPTIIQQLQTLHAYRIIEYQPQLDSPQIFFLRDRVPAEILSINKLFLEERKRIFTERIESFLQFITDQNECRGQSIARYFGDNNVPACGICDNCLAKKKKAISKDRFEIIRQTVLKLSPGNQLTAPKLIKELPAIPPQQILDVLEQLQDENEIRVDENNVIHLGRN